MIRPNAELSVDDGVPDAGVVAKQLKAQPVLKPRVLETAVYVEGGIRLLRVGHPVADSFVTDSRAGGAFASCFATCSAVAGVMQELYHFSQWSADFATVPEHAVSTRKQVNLSKLSGQDRADCRDG